MDSGLVFSLLIIEPTSSLEKAAEFL